MDKRVLSQQCQKMVGWPFRMGGRDASGIDCLGVVLQVMGAAGISLPDIGRYGEGVDGVSVVEKYWQYFEPVESPEPGDILLFSGQASDRHVTIYLGYGKILHAVRGCGVVVGQVRCRPLAAYRAKGLAQQ